MAGLSGPTDPEAGSEEEDACAADCLVMTASTAFTATKLDFGSSGQQHWTALAYAPS